MGPQKTNKAITTSYCPCTYSKRINTNKHNFVRQLWSDWQLLVDTVSKEWDETYEAAVGCTCCFTTQVSASLGAGVKCFSETLLKLLHRLLFMSRLLHSFAPPGGDECDTDIVLKLQVRLICTPLSLGIQSRYVVLAKDASTTWRKPSKT